MAEQKAEQLDLGREKEKSSKVLLYVVVVLILLVLGLGAVLLHVLGVFGTKGASVEARQEPAPPPKVPIYVSLDKDLVVNLPPNNEARLMQVGIAALVYDPQVEAVLKKHMPMLRNNINLLLAGQDAAEMKRAEGKEALRAKVLDEVNKVVRQQVPDGTAEQVFFTSFVLQ